jgi:tyrosyl-tRNA synthetase
MQGLFFAEERMGTTEREINRQFEAIAAMAAEIIPADELRLRLKRSLECNAPLRIKYGIDPTNPDVHIGHLVPCRMIRTFQDLGHTAVLIIGDYTARIGDPSGLDAERPPLSVEQIAANVERYAEQLFSVVDKRRAEVHKQSDWFGRLELDETIRLLSRFSVAQMLAHETFRSRLESAARLGLHELVYPVLQAYDSVRVRADVEIGGTDQMFNCLCGRDLQRSNGFDPQIVVTVPLLMGPDRRKMSKSLGNHIAVTLEAREIVGRVMSTPDDLLEQYVTLSTNWSVKQRRRAMTDLNAGRIHPRDLKLEVAKNVATQLRGEAEAHKAVDEFERVFREGAAPDDMVRQTVADAGVTIIDLLVTTGMAISKSEARRLVEQGGVRLDGTVVDSVDTLVRVDHGGSRLLKVGKRRFLELVSDRP